MDLFKGGDTVRGAVSGAGQGIPDQSAQQGSPAPERRPDGPDSLHGDVGADLPDGLFAVEVGPGLEMEASELSPRAEEAVDRSRRSVQASVQDCGVCGVSRRRPDADVQLPDPEVPQEDLQRLSGRRVSGT